MIKNVNEAVIYSAAIPRDPLYFFFFSTFLMENWKLKKKTFEKLLFEMV